MPLIVFGRSLGGAASIHSLSRAEYRYACKGLILENTFTSIYDVAANFVPKLFFFLNPLLWIITAGSYNSEQKLRDVHVPALFIKGCKDLLIPKVQMDKLHQQYKDLRKEHFDLEIAEGTHNDTWAIERDQYFSRLKEFAEHCAKL